MSELLRAAKALIARAEEYHGGWIGMVTEEIDVLKAAVAEEKTSHVYLSTACRHQLHAQCRIYCKFCEGANNCVCDCHLVKKTFPRIGPDGPGRWGIWYGPGPARFTFFSEADAQKKLAEDKS